MKRAEHVAIFGPSGGGKTTFLREMHARHEGPSVFLSPKADEHAEHDPPRRTLRSGASYPRDITRAREWAKGKPATVQVIVDECQQTPTFTDGEGPTKDMLHEDRSDGVKCVISTQNPQDLNTRENGYGPVQQARYWVFCGPLKDWHVGFMNANNLSGLVEHMPTRDYEYVVVEPTASLTGKEKILYRGETKEQFA